MKKMGSIIVCLLASAEALPGRGVHRRRWTSSSPTLETGNGLGGGSDLRAEHVGRDLRDLGRRLADAHALGLERFLLRHRGALRPRDDRAGVTHGLARR